MTTVDLHRVGAALAAPGRARMIDALLDGREHTSGELARAAGLASGTASEHLGVLVAAGLVSVRRDGRHHRVRITDPDLAGALEVLSRGQTPPTVTSYRLSAEQRRVRAARTCYDHLAGRLGVGVHEALTNRGWLAASGHALTDAGRSGLLALGIDVPAVERVRRPAVGTCVDWTERRPHLAGSVGAAVADLALREDWVRRVPGTRALRLTARGRESFADRLGVADSAWLTA